MSATEQSTAQVFFVHDVSVLESPRTASDVARELGRSVTAIKKLAAEIHAPIQKTASGIWIFPLAAVEKLRHEIQRRELERLK
ncbi:MAG: hypothetical protein HY360_07255 [Verrucomicrobia bacterium]|nr:hypothetical protein [Verrucomicrobiota bacterium]